VQVQSAAEVQHLLACHPLRLLVLHVATAGCPLSQVGRRMAAQCRACLSADLKQLWGTHGRTEHTAACAKPLPAATALRSGLPASQAFQPRLHHAASQHPAALFLSIAVQPGEVAAAALSSAARVPTDVHAPGSAAERISLLRGLGVGRLPCTLLLRGHELLGRVQVGDSWDSMPSARAAGDTAASQLAAALQRALGAGAACAGGSATAASS
jgi:hypothetical protein